MILNNKQWKILFGVCLGIFAGTAFCMKWIEPGFRVNDELFTILGLEIFYSQERVSAILSGINSSVRTLLQYHLVFDFAFMAGVYPGIAALCMMARNKVQGVTIKKILLLFALLQFVALVCDVTENIFLLNWINSPAEICCFHFYHFIVITKWILALSGAVAGILVLLLRRKTGIPV